MSETESRPRPAVFLDRDGTIIEDHGDLHDPSQVEFFEDTIPALLRLAEAEIGIAATYGCPHERRDGCLCMKPNPFFLLKAETEHRIDLRRSFVIGDHPHDVEFAKAGGAAVIYVLTGHGLKHLEGVAEGTAIAAGIHEDVEFILETEMDQNS